MNDKHLQKCFECPKVDVLFHPSCALFSIYDTRDKIVRCALTNAVFTASSLIKRKEGLKAS